jgi:hypothetical protein
LLTVEHHPRRSIRLFQVATAWYRCAPVEYPDIVKAEKSTLKQMFPERSFLLSHQVKFTSSFENAYVKNSKSPLPLFFSLSLM